MPPNGSFRIQLTLDQKKKLCLTASWDHVINDLPLRSLWNFMLSELAVESVFFYKQGTIEWCDKSEELIH